MRDRILFCSVNGVTFLINLIVYFVYCSGDSMISAMLRGMGWQWIVILLFPLIVLAFEYGRRFALDRGAEDFFAFFGDVTQFLYYVLCIFGVGLGIYLVVDGYAYEPVRVLYVLTIINAVFNLIFNAPKKEI